MRTFAKFFKTEFHRLLTPRNLIIGALFFIIAMSLVQFGADRYRGIITDKESFKQMEQKKVERYQYPAQYAYHGFRVLYIPPASSIFFHKSGLSNQVTATINANARLSISESLVGKDIFNKKKISYDDFSGFLFFLGGLILLAYGCETTRPTEYLKTLSRMSGTAKVYACLAAFRFLLLSLFFIVTTAAGVLLVLINGIHLQGSDYADILYHLGFWELAAFFLFLIGTFIGRIKSKSLGNVVVVAAWLLFVYLLPLAINKITTAGASDITTNYNLEKKKFDQLIEFEDRAKSEVGNFTKKKGNQPSGRDIINSFMNIEYKKIREFENELSDSVERNIILFHWLSVVSPPTLFLSVTGEQSGLGYVNSLEFLRYIMELKHGFCLFYREQKFYSDNNKVVSFIKDPEKYLFYGKSRLPANSLPGFIIMLAFTVGLAVLSYVTFKYSLFNLSADDLKKFDNKDIDIKKGKAWIFKTRDKMLASLFFSLFSGYYNKIEKKGFTSKFLVQDFDKISRKKPLDFLYFPSDKFFPGDIRIKDFISLCAALMRLSPEQTVGLLEIPVIRTIKDKRYSQLKINEFGEVPLALTRVKKSDVYLLFDIAARSYGEFVMRFMERVIEMKDNGALAVYVTTDDSSRDADDPEDTGIYYWENDYWLRLLKNYRMKYRKEKEE
jgi:hypothetical protein